MEFALLLILFILVALFSTLAVSLQRRRRSGGVVGIGPRHR